MAKNKVTVDQHQGEEKSSTEQHWEAFLTKHGKNCLYAILCIVVVVVVGSRFSSWQQTSKTRDFVSAEAHFTAILSDNAPDTPLTANPSFDKLEEIMARHPELHDKYDNALAHALLKDPLCGEIQDKVDAALKRSEQLLKTPPLDLYRDYTETSVLINDGQFEAALVKALSLQHTATDLSEKPDTLLAFNALRIASLYQQLGRVQEEQQTWQQVKEEISSKSKDSGYDALAEHLQEGHVSLSQYIQARVN